MTTTLPGRSANNALGRSRTAFVGMARMTISPPLAASATETGLAPSSAASAARLSGPFEFAIETRWPSLTRWRARIPPMLPAPMIPTLMSIAPFSAGEPPSPSRPLRRRRRREPSHRTRAAPRCIPLPGAVAELTVDPPGPGDEAVAFDGGVDLAGVRVDLMDLARAIFAHPE